MPTLQANDITLEYDLRGRDTDPVVLLIMGFTMQLIHWDDAFCDRIAARGFRVLRFDNRDAGRSTHLRERGIPNIPAVMSGDASSLAYTLDDMADDAAALLAGLAIPSAHVVGASMGGMIAQLLALRHPGRVRSLCSIMSTTGDRSVGHATPEALSVLFTPPPTTRDENINSAVTVARIIGSPAYPIDEAHLRARAAAAYDRAFDPPGGARQFAAILAARDRSAQLAGVRVPTVVIHGESDPLIAPSGGEATARAIPGATLELVPGMGHDFPPELWDRIIDAIVRNAAR